MSLNYIRWFLSLQKIAADKGSCPNKGIENITTQNNEETASYLVKFLTRFMITEFKLIFKGFNVNLYHYVQIDAMGTSINFIL